MQFLLDPYPIRPLVEERLRMPRFNMSPEEAEAVALEPGDCILLLTDGIFEAVGGDQSFFGIDRALDVVRAHRDEPAGRIVEALHRAVRDFAGQEALADDVTSVVIKVDLDAGPPGDR